MSALESIYRNELSTLFPERGYNVHGPVMDRGIDFIVHREVDGDIMLVQQKSRWTIARTYLGRGIRIAFRSDGYWYLAPHDEMVERAAISGTALASSSWSEGGIYHRSRLNASEAQHFGEYRLGAAAERQGEGATDDEDA